MSFSEQIFSIKNDDIRKVITVLGTKIKLKSKKLIERKRLINIENKLTKLSEKLNKQKEKIKSQQEKIKRLKEKTKKQADEINNQKNYIENLKQDNSNIKIQLNNLQKKVNPIIQSYSVPHINKEKIACEIENFNGYGLNETEDREKKVIVSLTSYPDRMYDIHYALYSLLNQNFKPDKIILWLAKEQFPNLEKAIPSKVLDLCKYGLTISWCDDIKSYKKLIPVLPEYPEDIIVTADDDVYYAKDWLKKLYDSYLESDGKTIIAHRCHKVGYDNELLPYEKWEKCINNDNADYNNFFTGVGGVLYPPHVLHNDVQNRDLYMKLTPNADDIWFWTMALLNNTKIKTVKEPDKLVYINIQRELNLNDDTTLYSANINDNDKQFTALLNHYPEILEKIK